jgi:predicted secreted Zn-dependent protease
MSTITLELSPEAAKSVAKAIEYTRRGLRAEIEKQPRTARIHESTIAKLDAVEPVFRARLLDYDLNERNP